MTTTLTIAVSILWLVVAVLVVAVFALARQVGVLYERVAPMGALMMDEGPKVGEVAPVFNLTTLSGARLAIGAAGAFSTLLFFLSPTCPVCKKLLPVLRLTARDEADWLRVVLASDGEESAQRVFCAKNALSDFPYVLSAELGLAYKVSKLPFAVLLDETGRVRSKGLINSREQLESLFTAKDLGVESIQQFLQKA
jgi:methylamine dehydrogenase accessory protein MauD